MFKDFHVFELSHLLSEKLVAYYEAVFHNVTNNKMTVNDTSTKFTYHNQNFNTFALRYRSVLKWLHVSSRDLYQKKLVLSSSES